MAPTAQAFDDARTYASMAKGQADTAQAADIAAVAQAFALLAVVEELRALRGAVEQVAETLRDGHGFDVGSHMRGVSDSLERIAQAS